MAHRAALVGCGLIGSEFADTVKLAGIWSHAAAYAANPDTELVALCDSDSERLSRCASRWPVERSYRDYGEMLADAQPEIVSVCVPDALHYEVIAAAVGQPSVRAVFAEKPLACELEQARELVALAAGRGVLLAVNYTRRYAPGFIELGRLIAGGALGRVQTLSGYYTKGVAHNGSHWFDLVDHLLGPIAEVCASDRLREPGADPTLDVGFSLESGVRGYLHGCDAKSYALFEMDIVGSEGRARIVDSGLGIELQRVGSSAFGAGYRSLAAPARMEGGLGQALPGAVADIVSCLASGETPRCSGAAALRALGVSWAAQRSARSGAPVRCALP